MSEDLRNQVLVRAWKDPHFREAVRRNPREALSRHGFYIPEGISINVVDDTPDTYNLVLREPPAGSPSTVEPQELRVVAAASSSGQICTLTAECGCPASLTGACSLFCPNC